MEMSDNQTYYYIRVKENFFDEDVLKLIEAMQDGYLYSNILLKLYLKSLKLNGKLMVNERIPYNPNLLATITGHQVGTIEKALNIFKELDLIEVLDNGAIYMLNIQSLIGKSSTEADRKRIYRNRIATEKAKLLEMGQMSGQCPLEIDIEKELELELELEGREGIDYQQITDMYNDTCVSFPKVRNLSDVRKKDIKERLNKYSIADFQTMFKKAEASNFLKGSNDRSWTANFDWMIKDSNMAKILDGNYDNPKSKVQTNKHNNFHNFNQRDYDNDEMVEIERQLIKKQRNGV